MNIKTKESLDNYKIEVNKIRKDYSLIADKYKQSVKDKSTDPSHKRKKIA